MYGTCTAIQYIVTYTACWCVSLCTVYFYTSILLSFCPSVLVGMCACVLACLCTCRHVMTGVCAFILSALHTWVQWVIIAFRSIPDHLHTRIFRFKQCVNIWIQITASAKSLKLGLPTMWGGSANVESGDGTWPKTRPIPDPIQIHRGIPSKQVSPNKSSTGLDQDFLGVLC